MEKRKIDLTDKSIQHLKAVDPTLSKVIDRVGAIDISIHADPFEFLVGEIVGQMLSSKMSDVLTDRLVELCGGSLSPSVISKLSEQDFRNIGISKAKASYIITIAQALEDGAFELSHLEECDDESVKKELMQFKGIGQWTAKMYLLFCLHRSDILPFEDVAFLQAYKWLFQTDDVSRSSVERNCALWSPYRSIAARYLYRALDSGLTKISLSDL